MKFKVKRRIEDKIVKINFAQTGNEYGMHPWITDYDIVEFMQKYNHVCQDEHYTIRMIDGVQLLVWYGAVLKVNIRMDVKKFFKVLNKIKPNIEITMDSESFKFKETEMPVNKSWVEIGKWLLLSDKGAIQNILNANELGLAAELKPILSRFVDKAYIYRDYGSKFSFVFSKSPSMGYNGGIICHGVRENTFSVELDPSNKPHYSVHT